MKEEKPITSTELKLIMTNELMAQEQRFNVTLNGMIDKISEKFATKEQLNNFILDQTKVNTENEGKFNKMDGLRDKVIQFIIFAVLAALLSLVIGKVGL